MSIISKNHGRTGLNKPNLLKKYNHRLIITYNYCLIIENRFKNYFYEIRNKKKF